MGIIRIAFIELKKSVSYNSLLCLILLISIITSYSVFVLYNDSFYNEGRRYLSSHLDTHSVTVKLEETVSYSEAGQILDLLNNSFCEYVLLSFDTETKSETYRINSVSALLPVARNPYNFLYSCRTRKTYQTPPASGCAYVSIPRIEEGLIIGRSFSVDSRQYMYSDTCAAPDSVEVLLSVSDFQVHDKVDSLTYVYRESYPLSSLVKINEKIADLFPSASVSVNNHLSEWNQNAYNEEFITLAVLLIACILNYCLIFSYIAGKRSDDYIIMRIFGITGLRISVMLLLEFVLYNALAFIVSMLGFSVYWLILNDTDIITHIRASLPVILIYIGSSCAIGIFHVIRLSRLQPVDYNKV